MTRIYQPVPIQAHTTLALDERASHYLARVLRVKTNDQIILFNGQGGEFAATIKHVDKKGVTVEVNEHSQKEVESPIKICLAQGIARGEKMDFIVQKSVELGVGSIVPLVTERCNVRLDNEREEKRLQHWEAVVISACEQSGRNRLPEIEPPVSLKQFLKTIKSDYKFVLSPHVDKKFPVDKLTTGISMVLLIGPEGGLSDEEVSLAIENGFLPLNLGPRILRTETASLAAISVLQSLYGDF